MQELTCSNCNVDVSQVELKQNNLRCPTCGYDFSDAVPDDESWIEGLEEPEDDNWDGSVEWDDEDDDLPDDDEEY